MTDLLLLLWLTTGVLVGYSYFLYQTNVMAHGLFLIIFLIISASGFLLDNVLCKLTWQKLIAQLLKVTLMLLAMLVLSAQFARLFYERLPLFD
ncbi:hypothetical protein [Moraxella sp. VT-16-12]|uniref:hypothetical protein n=1 Tax=Moraxella sp. VT-16-12 TaxID=2014877 RepID=UPI000B7CAC6A|nr:hypothetical protein [Moraxella sp. VT-16-12]TWV84631.1 hypothetical protein CEW93_000145 [Moraxella sp. VT-16-12]